MVSNVYNKTGNSNVVYWILKILLLYNVYCSPIVVIAQQATMSDDQFHKSVWVANALYNVNSKRAYEKVVLVNALNKAYMQTPDLSPSEAVQMLYDAQQKYHNQQSNGTAYDAINSMFNIIGTDSRWSRKASIAKEFLNWTQRATENLVDKHNGLSNQSEYYRSYSYVHQWQQKQWELAIKIANENPKAAEALNRFFAPFLNATTTDSPSSILANNPDFATNSIVSKILEQLQPNGSIKLTNEELKSLTKEQLAKLNIMIDSCIALLQDFGVEQHSVIKHILLIEQNSSYNRHHLELQSRMQQQQQLFAHQLEAAQSGIYLLSFIAGLTDKKFAQGISSIGNGSIQIASALQKYNQSSLSTKTSNLGAVILTGNVVGAAISMMSIFSQTSPTHEQLIYEQIEALRNDIASIRREMHKRFNSIDEKLDRIYLALDTKLAAIDVKLHIINGNVNEIQRTLIDLQVNLQRIEKNLYVLLNDVSRIELNTAINGGIGCRKSTCAKMEYANSNPSFIELENKFQTWATVTSLDASRAGPLNRSYDDSKVFEELTRLPLDANINYLADYTSRLQNDNIYPIASNRLPNFNDWALASESYIQLGLEWPEYARMVDSSRVNELIHAGLTLKNALQKITTIETSQGIEAHRNLFKVLIENYKNKLQAFQNQIKIIESKYSITNAKGLNLWEGANQRLTSYNYNVMKVRPCPGVDIKIPEYTAPAKYYDSIPAVYLNAELLGVDRIDLCYSNLPSTIKVLQVRETADGPWRYQFANFGYRIIASFKKRNISDRYMVSAHDHLVLTYSTPILFGAFFIPFEEASVSVWERGGTEIEGNLLPATPWNKGPEEPLKDRFVKESIELMSSTDIKSNSDEIERMVNIKLNEYQRFLYQQLIDSLSFDGRLYRAGIELSGAKSLLTAYISAGLPRSLETNDVLRALLYGNDALLDAEMTKKSYQMRLRERSTEPNMSLERVLVKQTGEERILLLDRLIKNALDNIDAGSLPETHRSLDLTLQRLEAYKRVIYYDQEPIPNKLRVSITSMVILIMTLLVLLGLLILLRISFAGELLKMKHGLNNLIKRGK